MTSTSAPNASSRGKIVYIEDLVDEYDEDGYKDEQDRAHLQQLQETEREMILYQRYEEKKRIQRTREKARREGRLRSRKEEQERANDSEYSGARAQASTSSQSQHSSSHAKALSDLSSKRRQRRESFSQHVSVSQHDAHPVSSSSSGSHRSSGFSTSQSSSQSSVSRYSSAEDPPFQLIKQVTISRHKLVKYVHEPYFERLVQNAFVRILIGDNRGKKIYRLARIKEVKTVKSYMVEDMGKQVHVDKLFTLSCGKDQDRGFSKISNSKPVEKEYIFWKDQTRKYDGEVPKVADINQKIHDIKMFTTSYIYSEQDIAKMTKNKKQKVEDMELPTLYRKVTESRQKLGILGEEDRQERDRLNNEITQIRRAIRMKEEALDSSRKVSISAINAKQEKINRQIDSQRKSREQVASQNDPFARISSESSFFDPLNASASSDVGNVTQSKKEETQASSSRLPTEDKSKKDSSIAMSDIHGFDIDGLDIGDLPSPAGIPTGTAQWNNYNNDSLTSGIKKRSREAAGLGGSSGSHKKRR